MEPDPEACEAVQALLERERHGVLCTAHARHGGWPFGSLTPYALGPEGDPVLLLSSIAEHTANLRADARASLLVQDRSALEQPLAGARITLMGRAETPGGARGHRLLECYLTRFPEAAAWAGTHDFLPFLLRVERVRWIRGFGSMGWIERAGARDP